MLSDKTILIGISGGIAAYKICELVRMFKRQNADVRIVATQNAMRFVTKLTLQNLSQNEVYVDEWDVDAYTPEHISACDEADIFVLAPATANTISKIANGICDNLLTSIACAFVSTGKPMVFAPAMNSNMFENPFVQENIQKLLNNGFKIVAPEVGYLACGTEGVGRLADINTIFEKTVDAFEDCKKLLGKRIVVTAGGTIEEIDPVRYISNYSSGKMGTAIADAAYSMGAEVTLITTKPVKRQYDVQIVKSASEMDIEVESMFNESDCIIMAAAVADYRVKNYSEQKMKKTENDELTLELVKNPDILKTLCQKRGKKSNPIIVGFCAESENLIENAKKKLKAKGCDYLIANDISDKNIGFSSDENEVYIFDKKVNITHIERSPKTHVARCILEEVFG